MRDQYNPHDIMKRVIDKVADDFEKQGIRLGINPTTQFIKFCS
jgi:hypothetical protein